MFRDLSPGALGINCTWLEGLDLARDAGFQGADLNLLEAEKLSQEGGVERVQELFSSRGLQMGAWGLPVNWRGPLPQFYAQLARLPELAEFAARLGCHRVTTGCPGWSDTLTRQEHWDLCVGRLKLIAPILKEHGHRLGIEFIAPRNSRKDHKYGFVYSMDGMLALCCAVGAGNVGLLFDVWHWYTACSSVDDIRHLTANDVVYVHINDAPAGIHPFDQMDLVRCLPGETGVIPNVEILQILKNLGYDGPVTVEPFSQSLKELAAGDPLAAARKARESLDPLFAAAGLS
ncbi:MAG: sugar phosphate isomerase/epimerase [Armatimonadetes bacterium]|nr:sugar phosphate isomerase/epimerase [Armatimonadota bacterium]MBM3947579.1 sugar phosphate isomerase/epimerase [SAR202 cluster bacterium]